MEPYRIDFAMRRGHELILDREQPITREELDTMELQMLRGNTIPFLLPVEWIDIDGYVTFRYAIEGKRMLAHQLQLHELTMQDMYACLLAIADALDACKSYLLRPECCLLKDSCLFIGDRWDEVYLLYVPVRKPCDEYRQAAEGPNEFTSLAMRLSSHVKDLDGHGLQKVLRLLLDHKGSTRSALRKVLLELLEGRPDHQGLQVQKGMQTVRANQVYYGHDTDMGAMQELYGQPGLPHEREDTEQAVRELMSEQRQDRHNDEVQSDHAAWFRRKASSTARRLPQLQSQGPGDEIPIPVEARESLRRPGMYNQSMETAVEERLEELPEEARPGSNGHEHTVKAERSRWIVLAAGAIADALVWRYGYLSGPSNNRLLISLGATVMITAAAYIAGWRSRSRITESTGSSLEKDGRRSAGNVGQLPQWSLESGLLEGRAASVPVKAERRLWPEVAPSADYPAVNMDTDGVNLKTGYPQQAIIRTSLDEPEAPAAAASEATVWIGHHPHKQAGDGDKAEEKLLWQLERTFKGGSEPLTLSLADSSSFLIGRTGGKVHFEDEHPGISRIHLEFGCSEECVSVKDLGSRNGTTLNGNPMIAYKIYKLQSGDALQLAGNDGPTYTVRQLKEAVGA